MKQTDETKKTEIPAPGAEVPDGELEAVSGGGQETPQYGGLVAPPNTAPLLR